MRCSPVIFSKVDFSRFDALVASDFLDLATLRGLAEHRLPTAVYMHENQISYPSLTDDERDNHFKFNNITSCLAADKVWFNSDFHRQQFFDEAKKFISIFPKVGQSAWLENIKCKSEVHYLGVELAPLPLSKPINKVPSILWNHRWEHDKNPDEFLEVLRSLSAAGQAFELILCGQRFARKPEALNRIETEFAERIRFNGEASKQDYWKLLESSDFVFSTANHEFFGISVVEALSKGCWPLLPRRLSYPEIISDVFHSDVFYDTTADIVKLWEKALPQLAGRQNQWAEIAQRFSWAERIGDFDRAIAAMIK